MASPGSVGGEIVLVESGTPPSTDAARVASSLADEPGTSGSSSAAPAPPRAAVISGCSRALLPRSLRPFKSKLARRTHQDRRNSEGSALCEADPRVRGPLDRLSVFNRDGGPGAALVCGDGDHLTVARERSAFTTRNIVRGGRARLGIGGTRGCRGDRRRTDQPDRDPRCVVEELRLRIQVWREAHDAISSATRSVAVSVLPGRPAFEIVIRNNLGRRKLRTGGYCRTSRSSSSSMRRSRHATLTRFSDYWTSRSSGGSRRHFLGAGCTGAHAGARLLQQGGPTHRGRCGRG